MSREFIIRRRPFLKRLIRIPKMWYLQWINLKGVPIFDKCSFLLVSARIVLKPYK